MAAALCCLPAVLLLTGSPNIVSAAPSCSPAAVDNGDGWGWENNSSCRWSDGDSAPPACTAAAVDNGDGWGWENNQSCRYDHNVSADTTAGTDSTPECSPGAINNGDGWGWENNASCVWANGNSAPDSTAGDANCTAAAIDNGDGWGWENGQSCRFVDSGGANTNNNSNTGDTDFIGNTPQCSVNATDNGDGWGFELGRSCLWGDRQQTTELSQQGAAPPPVAAAIPGYENGTPICLTDSSDGNEDGFGYENNSTCKVVAGVTATPGNPLLNTRWCQPWAEIAYGDYVLQNNTWNDSDVWFDTWSQCITLDGGPGNYIAKWDYNWLQRDQGNEYSVKSYPQVYYGRKTGNTTSGTPQRLGLPAHIDSLPDFKVRYKYSETGSPERNVALESFFHTSCEAEEWNKQFEMMIWVAMPNTKTPGTIVAENVTIDNKVWDVYVNPSLGWGYVAFVVKEQSNEGILDWNEFVRWTRYQGPGVGVWEIGNNTCMGAIEIGTETFWGTGTFTLEEFEVYR